MSGIKSSRLERGRIVEFRGATGAHVLLPPGRSRPEEIPAP
ncbi:hypothetical protein [Streptomyces meridianus]|nr:hypothetical protein [Streptomyces meridianus]